MNIFVYSDESGVFDKAHNDIFVFGGLIFLSKESRDKASQHFSSEERLIRNIRNINNDQELKANFVSNTDKGKLYRSLNSEQKFGVIINEQKVNDSFFIAPKTKQRYLDYAYKIALKRKLKAMIKCRLIIPEEVSGIYIFADEHTTATDGKYELRESIEQEFRWGIANFHHNASFPPIFPNLKVVEVQLCDSKKKTLIRAADITANKLYHAAIEHKEDALRNELFNIENLP